MIAGSVSFGNRTRLAGIVHCNYVTHLCFHIPEGGVGAITNDSLRYVFVRSKKLCKLHSLHLVVITIARSRSKERLGWTQNIKQIHALGRLRVSNSSKNFVEIKGQFTW